MAHGSSIRSYVRHGKLSALRIAGKRKVLIYIPYIIST